MNDEEGSLAVLEERHWNLQRAIELVLDGESSRDAPRRNRQGESSAPFLASSRPVEDAIPRRIGSNPPPRPSLWRILTLPFLWGFKLFWTVVSFTCKSDDS